MGVSKSFVVKRDDTALEGIFRMYATCHSSLSTAFQASSATAWLTSVDHIGTASQHRTMAHCLCDFSTTAAQQQEFWTPQRPLIPEC